MVTKILYSERRYGRMNGASDVDNAQVNWQDVSLDYDFSQGMPQTVEVKFINDAWGRIRNGD